MGFRRTNPCTTGRRMVVYRRTRFNRHTIAGFERFTNRRFYVCGGVGRITRPVDNQPDSDDDSKCVRPCLARLFKLNNYFHRHLQNQISCHYVKIKIENSKNTIFEGVMEVFKYLRNKKQTKTFNTFEQ